MVIFKVGFLVCLAVYLAALTGLLVLNREENTSAPTVLSATSDPLPEIRVVSTNPSLTDNPILMPDQAIEITFSIPFENAPELKYEFSPKLDHIAEVSADKKTVRFKPRRLYDLGQGYSLKIGADAKFEGKKTLGFDLFFHFRTISYKGI